MSMQERLLVLATLLMLPIGVRKSVGQDWQECFGPQTPPIPVKIICEEELDINNSPESLAKIEAKLKLQPSAKLEFLRGIFLCQLGRYEQAKAGLENGRHCELVGQSKFMPWLVYSELRGSLVGDSSRRLLSENDLYCDSWSLVVMGIALANENKDRANMIAATLLQRHPTHPLALKTCTFIYTTTGRTEDAVRTAKIYVPQSNEQFDKLTESEWGRLQLANLKEDLPATRPVFEAIPKFESWVCTQFEGIHSQVKIRWAVKSTYHGESRAFILPGDPVELRVVTMATARITPALLPDYYISALVFELFNARNSGKFESLFDRARKSAIAKEDFVNEVLSLEYEALLERRKFFLTFYFDAASTAGIKVSASNWGVSVPEFEAFQSHIKSNAITYPFYYRQYDMLRSRNSFP